ncbi:MAG: hypothetical protein GY777_15880 [Candidatus Brocadiaceae bacterium]|nr:hypothetical protein [Candidatus Brocadiaceae bacterium]
MKESTLLEMQNKIKALTNIINFLMKESDSIRTLSVGTLETLKLMPGYDEAIEKLKESLTKEEKEAHGVIEQDPK